MRRLTATLFGLAVLVSSAALACSNCVRDIVSAEEWDRRSWDWAEHVFVVTVTAATISEPIQVGASNKVFYTFRIEETLKGEAKPLLALFTQRPVDGWNSDLGTVSCPDVVIAPGDRLLVFSDDGVSDIYIARCSATRLIESIIDHEASKDGKATMARIRAWSKE